MLPVALLLVLYTRNNNIWKHTRDITSYYGNTYTMYVHAQGQHSCIRCFGCGVVQPRTQITLRTKTDCVRAQSMQNKLGSGLDLRKLQYTIVLSFLIMSDIAIEKGIDVSQFSAIATPNQCIAGKRKLPGGWRPLASIRQKLLDKHEVCTYYRTIQLPHYQSLTLEHCQKVRVS